MTPRTVAVIGLRLMACWILIQALFGAGEFLFMMLSRTSARVVNPIIAPSFDRTHTSSISGALLWLNLAPIVMRLGGGFVLLFVSKPIGRLVVRGVD